MSKSTKTLKRNKNPWFKFFAFGKQVPKDDHPRLHIKSMKPLKVAIKRKRKTEHEQVLPTKNP